MRIFNDTHIMSVNGSGTWLERLAGAVATSASIGRYPLRAAVTRAAGREALVESTFVEFDVHSIYRERFHDVELAAPRRKHHQASKFAVVQIVPTGVRCEIGGDAGE